MDKRVAPGPKNVIAQMFQWNWDRLVAPSSTLYIANIFWYAVLPRNAPIS